MNLKKAIENKDLESFIKDREAEKGNKKAFNSTLASMVGKSKVTQASSGQDEDDNYSDTQTP